MRVMISTLILFFLATVARAQLSSDHLRLVDSIENSVGGSLKKYVVKNDTGRKVIPNSKNQTFSYKKQFYVDPKTNNLHMVTYLRLYSNGTLVNETYYYLHNKPLSAYVLKQAKRQPTSEQPYYFYNDQTYKSDSVTLKPKNEIITNAESFLREYKKMK